VYYTLKYRQIVPKSKEKTVTDAVDTQHSAPSKDGPTTLHIFVNRRKFETGDGVREQMTGAQIAALIEVPADNAVIRLESGPDQREIGINETIEIKNGEQFLVTRKVVEGGHEPRAH
jgi:hypothetical protein